MSDNSELEQRVAALERQMEVFRKAEPIQSLPGNTLAFKAFLKGLLATKVPKERDAFVEIVKAIANADAVKVTPLRSLSDVDSPARRQMLATIDEFLTDLNG